MIESSSGAAIAQAVKAEPDPRLVEEARKLTGAGQILTVYVVKSLCSAHIPPHMLENEKLDFAVNHSVNWAETADKLNLLSYITMKIQARLPDGKQLANSNIAFDIEVVLCTTYLMSGEEFSQEAKKFFCEHTATFNTYPYLREFFDSASRRMGYKPVVIPLLKAQ